jgi:hypothetical protein
VAVVLVATTTTLVGREWRSPHEETGPHRNADAAEELEAAAEGEEEGTEENQENLNVLHLLYTIAQVRPSKCRNSGVGPSAPRRVCASGDFMQQMPRRADTRSTLSLSELHRL